MPAYAGIPLTTKHDREVAVISCSDAKVDWAWYADDKTLVLLSACGSIGEIAAALVEAGRRARDPGRDDADRHHHRPGDGRVHARATSPRTPRRPG